MTPNCWPCCCARASNSVKELAADILNTFGGLAGLLRVDQQALRAVKGLGPAKGAELIAVMELVKRGMTQSLREQPVFQRVEAVAEYLQVHLGLEVHEVFAVLFWMLSTG